MSSVESTLSQFRITQLLKAWENGDDAAFRQAITLVYEELALIAHRHLVLNPQQHASMGTRDLVNEVYLKLSAKKAFPCVDSKHFLCLASRIMRQISIDYARAKQTQKRGGPFAPVPLAKLEPDLLQEINDVTILKLNEGLNALERIDNRKSSIVEMHFFAGLNFTEIATVLDISVSTVKREWQFTKAYLGRFLDMEDAVS